jgi:hypothetical protein
MMLLFGLAVSVLVVVGSSSNEFTSCYTCFLDMYNGMLINLQNAVCPQIKYNIFLWWTKHFFTQNLFGEISTFPLKIPLGDQNFSYFILKHPGFPITHF